MASVFACLAAMILLSVTVLAVRLGAADLARHRAETGADLAALAGAGAALSGEGAACQAAAVRAQANATRLTSCRLDVLDVVVEVSVTPWAGATVIAHARGGPADSVLSP